MAQSSLIKVANFANVLEAETMRSALEANGIPAFLEGAHASTVMPHLGVALGGVRLMVHSTDAGRALDLLESIRDDTGTPASDWFCGQCQEHVGAEFYQCWSCGGDRQDIEQPPLEALAQTAQGLDHRVSSLTHPEVESLLKSAWNASALGVFLLPIIAHVYSAFLLWRVSMRTDKLSAEEKKSFRRTSIVNACAVLFWGVILWKYFPH